MALTVTNTPGYTVATSGDQITPAKLNLLGQPTFTVTGTIATADIAAGAVTSAKSTPGPYHYVASTFSSNVYTVTLSPALASYADGAEVWFKAASANTASASVNVNGLGNKVIKKLATLALVAGDIASGQIVGLRYDSTNGVFQMISPVATQVPVIPASAKGLVIKNTSGSENTSVDCTATHILLQDASNNTLRIDSFSATAAITAGNVLGGLDTGVEANSTWYYIWALSTGSLNYACLSTSATTPNAAFLTANSIVYKGLLGAVYNNSAGNFLKMYQSENRVYQANQAILSGTAAAVANTWESLSIAAAVPPIAKTVMGLAGSKNATHTSTFVKFAPSDTVIPGEVTLAIKAAELSGGAESTIDSWYSCGTWEIGLVSAQTLYWQSRDTNTRTTAEVNGYTI